MNMEVDLLKSVDNVSFGMTREEVRKQWGEATEFMKNEDDIVPTDDFGFCHVYYDMDDKCEAIEIFDADVYVEGKKIYPIDMDEAAEKFPYLVRDSEGFISEEKSIGIYAPDDEMESILFAIEGYYSE